MKKTIIGIILFVIGSLELFVTHFQVMNSMSKLTSWQTDLGPYGHILAESHGLLFMSIGAVTMIAGLIILAIEYFGKEK